MLSTLKSDAMQKMVRLFALFYTPVESHNTAVTILFTTKFIVFRIKRHLKHVLINFFYLCMLA